MKKIIITALYLFFSVPVQAWTINADFENGTIGEKANGTDGFSAAFKNTKYTDKVTFTGKRSAVLGIAEGSTGWGEWGGAFIYPEPLYEGDEVWLRVWSYFPHGFSFECGGCTQGMKFMRIRTTSAADDNEGYHSILVENGIEVDSEVTGKIFHSNNAGKKSVGKIVTTGAWHAYEMYIKFSSVDGNGIYRVWQDGKLIFQDTVTRTLNTSTSKSDVVYLFTYWNNGAPKTQSAYVDDVVVTSVKPSTIDAYGNPFIGVGDAEQLVSPPLPPLLDLQ